MIQDYYCLQSFLPAMHSIGGQIFHITSSFLYDYWQTFNTESVCSKFTSDLDLNLNFVPHQKLWKRQKTHTKKRKKKKKRLNWTHHTQRSNQVNLKSGYERFLREIQDMTNRYYYDVLWLASWLLRPFIHSLAPWSCPFPLPKYIPDDVFKSLHWKSPKFLNSKSLKTSFAPYVYPFTPNGRLKNNPMQRVPWPTWERTQQRILKDLVISTRTLGVSV